MTEKWIGIVLFDDVEELDAMGPWEVLASWAAFFPDDGWRVTTVADSTEPVLAAKGMRLVPHHSFADAPPLDVVVMPGGIGTRAQLTDEAALDRVRTWAKGGALMTSVCTGSLVYAAAGLLAGRPATTHWATVDELTRLDPSIELRTDDRYVDSGDVITSSGVSAGIDMALHLVRRLSSAEHAVAVRKAIQYDPEPPV